MEESRTGVGLLGIIHYHVLQCFGDATHQYALHYLYTFLYKVEKYDENGLHVISFAVLSIATFFFLRTQTLVLYCHLQFSCAIP